MSDERDATPATSLGTSLKPFPRERTLILGVAVGVAALVALYLGLRSAALGTVAGGNLFPYQMLVRDLVQADQSVFNQLRQSVLEAESQRAKTGQWPPADAVRTLPIESAGVDGVVPASPFVWRMTQQNIIVNYLGIPAGEGSAPAWLVRVQEPDPIAPIDVVPNDEVHHRLPDGTVLHVSIWTYRFGSQLKSAFFAKPETAGWTQLLTAPLASLSTQ
jgi:hypothetical protein